MYLKESYKLSNGVLIPKVGLGTWLIDNNDVNDVVSNAISLGYRHIDTAQAYLNEEGVGLGIIKSGVDRKDLFITSKIAAELKDFDRAYKSIDETLEKLNLEYIDLLIIHSPEPWNDFRGTSHYFSGNIEAYRALEVAYKKGKIKAIGVSNFLQEDLENIINNCEIKPMVNQILAHVSNTPFSLIEYCNKNDILVEAYSPIGHGELLKNKTLIEMAKKYHVSISSLCIKYILSLGLVALPKARSLEHLKDNINLDFDISDKDMEELKNMPKIENYGEHSFFPVFSGK